MTKRDVERERHVIPEAMWRVALFWGLPQEYLVLWLAVLTSVAIAVGGYTHPLLGGAVFAAGIVFVHPKLMAAYEDDQQAFDVVMNWYLNEHAYSEPHPDIWDAADRVRPSIPEK